MAPASIHSHSYTHSHSHTHICQDKSTLTRDQYRADGELKVALAQSLSKKSNNLNYVLQFVHPFLPWTHPHTHTHTHIHTLHPSPSLGLDALSFLYMREIIVCFVAEAAGSFYYKIYFMRYMYEYFHAMFIFIRFYCGYYCIFWQKAQKELFRHFEIFRDF